MQERIDAPDQLSEIPASQRRPVPKPIEHYISKAPNRDSAIVAAYSRGGYTTSFLDPFLTNVVRKENRAAGCITPSLARKIADASFLTPGHSYPLLQHLAGCCQLVPRCQQLQRLEQVTGILNA